MVKTENLEGQDVSGNLVRLYSELGGILDLTVVVRSIPNLQSFTRAVFIPNKPFSLASCC